MKYLRGIIRIDDSPPLEENEELVFITGKGEPNSASQLSDLDYLLYSKDWNITERLYIDVDGKLNIINQQKFSTAIPRFSQTPTSLVNISKDPIISEEDEFNNIYRKLMDIKPVLAIDLCDNEYISSRDLLLENSLVDILSQSDGSYTNILNLNRFSLTNTTSVILGVKYSKKDRSIGSEEIIFSGEKDFLHNIDNSLTIEYLNQCIRLFPSDENLIECIIDYCYLLHEQLI